jgi:ABC-2 type transport system ATP-binding protein
VGVNTIVMLKSAGDVEALSAHLARTLEGLSRSRVVDGGVELHVDGAERIVPRVVEAADAGGFDLIDLSVAEPTLETVFINLTGKDLRE